MAKSSSLFHNLAHLSILFVCLRLIMNQVSFHSLMQVILRRAVVQYTYHMTSSKDGTSRQPSKTFTIVFSEQLGNQFFPPMLLFIEDFSSIRFIQVIRTNQVN